MKFTKHVKVARNLTKYMSAHHIWKLSWLLGLLTCCKLANLPCNFVTAVSKQHPKTTRHSAGLEKYLNSSLPVWQVTLKFCLPGALPYLPDFSNSLIIHEPKMEVKLQACCFLRLLTAHANPHATSCNESARQVLKWTMIGQTAIAIELIEFNVLGCSVTPTFLSRYRLYLKLFPHCPKMKKKNQCGKLKKIQDFCPRDILPPCGWKAHEIMIITWELVLWGTSPVD